MKAVGTGVRSVRSVIRADRHMEGAGVLVRRPFPGRQLEDLDPFLLLDHLGPSDYGPHEMPGFPDHPHRGFETVTYVLEGKMEHHDSVGNHGILGPGDVQWMTAGAGVVHSEMPEKGFDETGGRFHGFQLWVNLPRAQKMIPPRYQDTPSAKMPVVRTPDGLVTVKVVAGESLGAKAVIETRIPIVFLHVTLEAGGRLVQRVPQDETAFVYVIEGQVTIADGTSRAHEGDCALLADDGDTVVLESKKRASLLLIAGTPLREPIARYGPFVMNTEAEIHQAIADFRAGRLGRIARPVT